MRLNDARFPVAGCWKGSRRREAAGLGPIKLNMVVKRGWNEHAVLPMARRFRGTGRILRFIEYMDVGHSNGWRLDDVVTADEILSTDRGRVSARTDAAHQARRGGASATATRWRRRDRRDRLGQRPFCGGVRPRPPLGRRPALHLPLRRRAATTCERNFVTAHRTRSWRQPPDDLGRTRRPLFGDPLGRDGRAAQGRDELHRRLIQP